MRACSPLACLLLVAVTAALALSLYAWPVSWLGATGWFPEEIRHASTGTPRA